MNIDCILILGLLNDLMHINLIIHKAGRVLIHWGRVMHICGCKIVHHCFRQWLVLCSAPSHYRHQRWLIVNWNHRNTLQWNSNRNSHIFIQENSYENAVCKIVVILCRPQYVNVNIHCYYSNIWDRSRRYLTKIPMRSCAKQQMSSAYFHVCFWSSSHYDFLVVFAPSFCIIMMTSSSGNIFRVTGLLCGEFTGPRWIPRTKASDADLWCFLWSAPE